FFRQNWPLLESAAAWAIKTNNKINIFTDSISFIDTHKSHRTKSKFVNSIKEKFCLAEGLVRLTWAKAHVGFLGNELCRSLLQAGMYDWKFMDIPLPYSSVTFLLNEKRMQEWNSHLEQFQSVSGFRLSGYVTCVDEKILVKNKAVIYFLTGHGPFPCYLSRFKILSFPNCECGSLASPDRYVFDCPLMEQFHLK
ncbi:hypothetical protein AVEN_45587-1, partial [Araneus ventricosus]